MRPPVLRWRASGILVPLRAEISESDPGHGMLITVVIGKVEFANVG